MFTKSSQIGVHRLKVGPAGATFQGASFLVRPLSTRNLNIRKNRLIIASKIYHFLRNKKRLFKKNIKLFNPILLKKELLRLGLDKIDYIKLYNYENFKIPKSKKENFKIFIAYYLDKIRLIDNI